MNSGNEQLHKIFKKGDELVSRQIAGETILVPIRGELVDMQQIFALNPVAEYIWQELDGQKDLSEVCEGVLANFEVDREQAEIDLQEFAGELLVAGLIREAAN